MSSAQNTSRLLSLPSHPNTQSHPLSSQFHPPLLYRCLCAHCCWFIRLTSLLTVTESPPFEKWMGKYKQLAVAHLTSRNTDKHTKAACITGASHEKAAICTDYGGVGGGNFNSSKSKRDLLLEPQISWLCDHNVTVCRA